MPYGSGDSSCVHGLCLQEGKRPKGDGDHPERHNATGRDVVDVDKDRGFPSKYSLVNAES